MANPLHSLRTWKSHLQPNGLLYLVLPDPEHTFDKGRTITAFQHLIEDEMAERTEADETHFEEIWKHFVENNLAEKFPGMDAENLLRNNLVHRTAHHHVFNLPLMKQMLEYIGFEVQFLSKAPPFHLIAVAQNKI